MWILSTQDDDRELKLRILPGGARTLGRARSADFVVEAALVSRIHCRFESDVTGRLEVVDLQSTNGTFVNERRVQRAVLAPGDRLRIGRLHLTVGREGPQPAPATED